MIPPVKDTFDSWWFDDAKPSTNNLDHEEWYYKCVMVEAHGCNFNDWLNKYKPKIEAIEKGGMPAMTEAERKVAEGLAMIGLTPPLKE